MNTIAETGPTPPPIAKPPEARQPSAYRRDYLGNQFVYLTISSRARGLSIGVNLNPDKRCNFDCVYCEVDRRGPVPDSPLDFDRLAAELKTTLALVQSGRLRDSFPYSQVPRDLLLLRHVAISGDGEPTLCPQFRNAIETIVHLRAVLPGQFFKAVLITNASNLDAAEVQSGLRLFTAQDEIWAKLDVGSQLQMNLVNKTGTPLEKILSNILLVGRKRPVVIQSLFASLNGHAPTDRDIEEYSERLRELTAAGAQISCVQIYSATRPTLNPKCNHLPLRTLSHIAQQVRSKTGLNVEVS
jgi:wyosine [tRNA(Phe)-imidazoG37] synthetase (radical SAM superfamily)